MKDKIFQVQQEIESTIDNLASLTAEFRDVMVAYLQTLGYVVSIHYHSNNPQEPVPQYTEHIKMVKNDVAMTIVIHYGHNRGVTIFKNVPNGFQVFSDSGWVDFPEKDNSLPLWELDECLEMIANWAKL